MSAACPICQSTAAEDLGPPVYRLPTTVAGEPIDLSDLDSHWWRCSRCGFLFIFPPIPQQRLEQCYQAASMGHWGSDESFSAVRFYDRKRELLERFAPGKRVLDFGCFDGGFLEYLGAKYEKFGIEPSTEAARVAASRGVNVLGATIESAAAAPPMHAIVAFDVFEHIPDPLAVLRSFHDRLAPGGIVMIETGNSDHPHWRRAGTRYPYMALVEHIAAFNQSSLAEAAKRAGLALVHFQVTAHHSLSLRHRIVFPMYQYAYGLLRVWDRLKLPLSAWLRAVARGPVPRVTGDDHFLAVLRRDG